MKAIYILWLSIALPLQLMAETYYVSTTGNNNNPGTISSPWETLKHALNTALNGDTILIMPGVYNERSVILLYSRSNIVVRGIGQVTINGYFPEFQSPSSGAWELWDASKNIYRSTSAYPSDIVRGTFKYNNQEFKFVHSRESHFKYKDLSSNNQYFDVNNPMASIYVGPGVYSDVDTPYVDPSNPYRIYVRLTPSRYMSNIDSAYANLSLNPNDFQLNIHYRYGNRIFMYGCTNISFEYINFMGYYFHMQDGCTNITFRNLSIHGGFINTHYVNTAYNNNITIDSVHFTGGQFHWVPYQDIKSFSYVAHSYEELCIAFQNKTTNSHIKNCFFENAFIAIGVSTSPNNPNDNSLNNIFIYNNRFERIIDDCVFVGSSSYNIDIYNNIMLGPGTGVSRHGTGISGHPGTKFIHHNVIDCSKQFLYGRSQIDGTFHPEFTGYHNTGLRSHFVFGHHGASINFGTEGDPRNIYNNTCLVGKGGIINVGLYNISPRNYAVKHKSYNNIFLQKDNYVLDKRSIYTDGSMNLDGNLYYMYNQGNNAFISEINEDDFIMYLDFSSFLAGTSYIFEQNGIYADPLLDTNYCPHSTDALGGVNLAIMEPTWPMVSGSPYRGALYPCTPTRIEDATLINDLQLYPNPANDKLFLVSNRKLNEYEVYNLIGERIITGKYLGYVDISLLTSGVYTIFIKEEGKDTRIQKKFIKLR